MRLHTEPWLLIRRLCTRYQHGCLVSFPYRVCCCQRHLPCYRSNAPQSPYIKVHWVPLLFLDTGSKQGQSELSSRCGTLPVRHLLAYCSRFPHYSPWRQHCQKVRLMTRTLKSVKMASLMRSTTSSSQAVRWSFLSELHIICSADVTLINFELYSTSLVLGPQLWTNDMQEEQPVWFWQIA